MTTNAVVNDAPPFKLNLGVFVKLKCQLKNIDCTCTTEKFIIIIFHLGLLGFGQEIGTEETFPLRELAHLLFQVHQSIGRLL